MITILLILVLQYIIPQDPILISVPKYAGKMPCAEPEAYLTITFLSLVLRLFFLLTSATSAQCQTWQLCCTMTISQAELHTPVQQPAKVNHFDLVIASDICYDPVCWLQEAAEATPAAPVPTLAGVIHPAAGNAAIPVV